MRHAFFLLAILGLGLINCTKTSTDPVQTKAQLITRTWQMQTASLTITASGLAIPIYVKGVTSNLVDFSTYQLALTGDGKFAHNDGSQIRTGTWQLLTNDTQLVLTYSDNSKATYTVDTASATNLDLSYQVLPTTQDETEKSYLAQIQALGQDASKGFKISTKLIPQ